MTYHSNTIIIEGSKEDMAPFKATLRTPNEHGVIVDFCFHQTVPRTDEPEPEPELDNISEFIAQQDKFYPRRYGPSAKRPEPKSIPGCPCIVITDDNWYAWEIWNWGTKTDVNPISTTIHTETDEKVIIQCQTDTGPPQDWARRFHDRFPNLQVTVAYYENGRRYYGKYVIFQKKHRNGRWFSDMRKEVTSNDLRYIDKDGKILTDQDPEKEYDHIEEVGELKTFLTTYLLVD